MAINVQDQGRVNLGGSSVNVRDTYTTPQIDDSSARNAAALAKSLEGFGGTLMQAGAQEAEQKQALLAAQRDAHALSIADAVAKGENIDVATGKIAPNLSKLNRAAAQQAAGFLAGKTEAEKILVNMPQGLSDDPERLAEWYNEQRRGLVPKGGNNPFYTAGILESANKEFESHRGKFMAQAAAESHSRQTSALAAKFSLAKKLFPPPSTPEEIRTGKAPAPNLAAPSGIKVDRAPNPGRASALTTAARELGINPYDLATIISYETMGKFDPSIRGGKGNKHIGLIQFGENEQSDHGAHEGQTFEQQLPAVISYLKQRGVKPGDDITTLYRIINGGNRNADIGASDGNGTIGGHVQKMLREHRKNAAKFLTGNADERLLTVSGRPDPSQTPNADGTLDPLPEIKMPEAPSLFGDEFPDGYLDSETLQLRAYFLDVDQEASEGATPQLSAQERKKVMIQEAISYADARGDPKFLAAVPEEMLTPEEREQMRKARDSVISGKWTAYGRRVGVIETEQRLETRALITRAYNDIRDGKEVDEMRYATGKDGNVNYEAVKEIRAARGFSMGVEESRAKSISIENDIFTAASSGNWDILREKYPEMARYLKPGVTPTVDDILDAVVRMRINTGDSLGLLERVPKLMEGAAIVQESVFSKAFDEGGAGDVFNDWARSPIGIQAAAYHPQIGAKVRSTYDNYVQSRIQAIVSQGRMPTADEKLKIADEANDKAEAYFNKATQNLRPSPNTPMLEGRIGITADQPQQQQRPQGRFVTQPDGTKKFVPG